MIAAASYEAVISTHNEDVSILKHKYQHYTLFWIIKTD